MTDTKKITQLTPGVTLSGSELLEMVQAGNSRSVRSDQFPLATDSFVTVSNVGLLPNSRYLAAGANIALVDGGPGSTLTITGTGLPITTPTFVVLSLDGVFPNERVLTGTANQVILTDGGPLGNITLSLPQDIATTSSPTFANLTLTNPLPPASGGTGIASYAIGDLLYASGATALSKLADVAAGSFLRSGGVATAPLWSTTTWPNAATTGDLLYASAANAYSNLADVAAGSYLRSGGVATAPVWSTTTLPNTATAGDLLYASAANTYANLADVAAGSFLRSGGVGLAPVWSTTTLPNAATTGDLLYASATDTWSTLADVAAGSFLRSGGVTTAPLWSTTTLPNAATTGDLLYASAANTYSNLADVAAGSFLRSGGVTTAPVWSTTTWPNAATQGDLIYSDAANAFVTLAKDANATRYLSNTGATNNPAWAQVNLANGVTGDLPFANLTQIAGLSVLGVTGNSTADVAAITAGSDGDILRRSGTTLAFGTVTLNAVNFANPTASVALAAVNGTAVTAMRSDAAPPISQSIAPTWSAKHIFSATGGGNGLTARAADPVIGIENTGAAADTGKWGLYATTSSLAVLALNDAYNASSAAITVARTGTTINSVTIPSQTIFQSSETAGPPTAAVFITSTAPAVGWYETDASSGSRAWDILVNGAQLLLRATLDDGTVAGDAMIFSRSSSTPVGPFFPNHGTTASAANAFIDSANAGKLLRSTSSLRYKTDVEDVAEFSAVLKMRPIKYRSLCESDDKDTIWYGLLAEEVAALDPHLVHFSRDEGGQLRPESVMYERLTVLTLGVVQQQAAVIRAMEARLRTLESA